MGRSWTSTLEDCGLRYLAPVPAWLSWVHWPVADAWHGLVSRAAYQRVLVWSIFHVPASALWRWRAPASDWGLSVREMTREQLENRYPVNIMVDTGTGEVIAEEYASRLPGEGPWEFLP